MIDRQKLDKTYVLEGQGTIAEWNADIDSVLTLQAALKRLAWRIGWTALAVFLLCIGLAILNIAPRIPFAVIGIVAGIVIFAYSLSKGKKGIVMDRVDFLRQLLTLLKEDSGESDRFKVTLHLRDTRSKISEGKNPRAASGKQIMLKDSWLTLTGRLRDRTTITHSVIDLIRKRTKKNPRGKIKTKERRVCLLRIQLAYKSETYGDAKVTALRLKKAIHLPQHAIMKALQFGESTMIAKTVVKGSTTSADLLKATQAVLLGSYRILNLSRRLAPPAKGSK